MIPLSNGRSPRIDQFYATLRTFKSHHMENDYSHRSEEQKSIQHIRSLGREIFEETSSRVLQTAKQKRNLYGHHGSVEKRENLYDKYKSKGKIAVQLQRQINRTKQIVIKEAMNKTREKYKKNPKYETTQPKITNTNSQIRNGLNYSKKADQEAQKIKKQKMEAKQAQRKVQMNHSYFYHSSKSFKISKQQPFQGVMRRTEELEARKAQFVQQNRRDTFNKEMDGVTFHPTKISKNLYKIQQNFEQRLQISKTTRTQKQRLVTKKLIQQHSFKPQLNQYKKAESKISKAWKDPTTTRLKQQLETNRDNDEGYKQQHVTANSTSHINLKAINQISFIF